MSNSIYTPYTYLIGWSNLNKYYYGVRTAKNCNPNDFWVKYFTSSKEVKKFRKENGDPDIIQIRKTFTNKEAALIWESKVLRGLNVKDRNDFLNLCNSYPDFNTKGYTTVRNLQTGKNELVSIEEFENGKNILYEHMNKGTITVRNLKTGEIEHITCEEFENNKGVLYEHHLTGSILSEEHKKKISEAKKNISNETRNKMSEYRKGKTLSEETKLKMSESLKGENHPFYNKHHSDESKMKMSESQKGKIWIVNKNNERTRIIPEKFEIYKKQGYRKGTKYK